jgi:hypothetical protein
VFAKKHLAVIDDAEGRTVHRIHKGDILSIHGTSGEVYVGTRAVDTGDQPNDDGADGDES